MITFLVQFVFAGLLALAAGRWLWRCGMPQSLAGLLSGVFVGLLLSSSLVQAIVPGWASLALAEPVEERTALEEYDAETQRWMAAIRETDVSRTAVQELAEGRQLEREPLLETLRRADRRQTQTLIIAMASAVVVLATVCWVSHVARRRAKAKVPDAAESEPASDDFDILPPMFSMVAMLTAVVTINAAQLIGKFTEAG